MHDTIRKSINHFRSFLHEWSWRSKCSTVYFLSNFGLTFSTILELIIVVFWSWCCIFRIIVFFLGIYELWCSTLEFIIVNLLLPLTRHSFPPNTIAETSTTNYYSKPQSKVYAWSDPTLWIFFSADWSYINRHCTQIYFYMETG